MNFTKGTATTVYTSPQTFPTSLLPTSLSLLPTATPTIAPSRESVGIGVALSICGDILISIAMNVQKHSHNQLLDTGRSYLRSGLWWIGLLLMGSGEVGNFLAYGFAPASLVAPLGSSGIVTNVIIAVLFLKERIRKRDIIGVTLAMVGAFLLVNFSNDQEIVLHGDEITEYCKHYPFIVYLVIEALAFAFILYLHHRRHYMNVVTILLQVAILGSGTVISAKALSSMFNLTLKGSNQLKYVIFYVMLVVMVVTVVAQIKFLNQAMKKFDTTVVMPTNFVFFTISAILSGIVFYREFWRLTIVQGFMFLFGALLSFVGVYCITGGRKEKPEPESDKTHLTGNGYVKPTDIEVQAVQDFASNNSTFTEDKDNIA